MMTAGRAVMIAEWRLAFKSESRGGYEHGHVHE